ncbi:MAG: vitamin K epoxide reductase family protein [Candidatus Eremiobacteraeota bacterium]|nr:vitamin K epoxide reductase family protein [Candidatus Eremiobacteraeota bacterium]
MRVVITVLCGVGLYASLFMLAKTRRAERGELTQPSVVQTPRARLLAGIPNAAFGMVYYVVLGVAVWFARVPWELAVLAIAALAAAAMSAILAYSLLFVTRMPCPYCWTSHAVNGVLAIVTILDFFKISYWQ